MLKILKGDLEAKELFQSEVPTVKNLQTDTHHLRYILVLKVFWKNVCFVTKIILQTDVSKQLIHMHEKGFWVAKDIVSFVLRNLM